MRNKRVRSKTLHVFDRKSKKANITVTILVIGVLTIFVTAMAVFTNVHVRVGGDFGGLGLMESARTIIREYAFSEETGGGFFVFSGNAAYSMSHSSSSTWLFSKKSKTIVKIDSSSRILKMKYSEKGKEKITLEYDLG